MGKRYQCILKNLDEEFECLDPSIGEAPCHPSKYDRFIIASPTDTHIQWVRGLDIYKKPILCEKPLSKDLGEVEEILECQSPLTMMMQYTWLCNSAAKGESYYNYFQHGKDGLVWDCFQIIALAQGDVAIGEDAPIWRCMINGRPVLRSHMDWAYVEYVRAWIKGAPGHSRETLLAWHKKVKKFEGKWNTRASA